MSGRDTEEGKGKEERERGGGAHHHCLFHLDDGRGALNLCESAGGSGSGSAVTKHVLIQ